MAKDSNNIHSGHRERLREKVIKMNNTDIDNFPPHEMLELLLFYVIPRMNTNELAHRLIEKFGSIDAVFDADMQSLVEVEGVGRQSAVFIKIVASAFRVYMKSKNDIKKGEILSFKNVGEYAKSLFFGCTNEVLFLISLDAENRVIVVEKICEGSLDEVRIDFRKIMSIALRTNAVNVILAHNHPRGSILPSEEDKTATGIIKKVLMSINVKLIDHIIVSGDEYVSMCLDLHIL